MAALPHSKRAKRNPPTRTPNPAAPAVPGPYSSLPERGLSAPAVLLRLLTMGGTAEAAREAAVAAECDALRPPAWLLDARYRAAALSLVKTETPQPRQHGLLSSKASTVKQVSSAQDERVSLTEDASPAASPMADTDEDADIHALDADIDGASSGAPASPHGTDSNHSEHDVHDVGADVGAEPGAAAEAGVEAEPEAEVSEPQSRSQPQPHNGSLAGNDTASRLARAPAAANALCAAGVGTRCSPRSVPLSNTFRRQAAATLTQAQTLNQSLEQEVAAAAAAASLPQHAAPVSPRGKREGPRQSRLQLAASSLSPSPSASPATPALLPREVAAAQRGALVAHASLEVNLPPAASAAEWALLASRVKAPETDITLARNWVAAAGLNTRLFEPAMLAEAAGDVEIELRQQYLKAGTACERNFGNRGQTWVCKSYSKRMVLGDYLEYRKGYRPRVGRNKYTTLLFGTNVDLSGRRWRTHLVALEQKVPEFMAWNGPGTLLSRLGHTIEGMSGVQLYLKVPGCRTPGHQENNCFASVNINLGPGACVWYTVDGRHRDVVDRICRVKAHCTLEGGSWWPIYEDLLAAGVNVRRFEQKAGDLVLVGPSCIHWVQALDSCINVSWNVGLLTAHQYTEALKCDAVNLRQNYRSVVPMRRLTVELAEQWHSLPWSLRLSVYDQLWREVLLVRDECEDLRDENAEVRPFVQTRAMPSMSCHRCQAEIFTHLSMEPFSAEAALALTAAGTTAAPGPMTTTPVAARPVAIVDPAMQHLSPSHGAPPVVKPLCLACRRVTVRRCEAEGTIPSAWTRIVHEIYPVAALEAAFARGRDALQGPGTEQSASR